MRSRLRRLFCAATMHDMPGWPRRGGWTFDVDGRSVRRRACRRCGEREVRFDG